MEIYLVGGAVRDKLLGITPKDNDYVVVGSSVSEMISLGYEQVGKDFPVFLHPTTKEDYALARTESKVGAGYNGFKCEWEGVTLEEDLLRRDLTINSIAMDIDTQEVIDPYNGRDDLVNGYLRPTGEHFKEDPIRVLRAARFLARHPTFKPTLELIRECSKVVSELEYCAPERIWLEVEKTLTEPLPSRFFNFLSSFKVFGFWEELKNTPQRVEHHPEIWCDIHVSKVMDYAASNSYTKEEVFASVMHDNGKPECYIKYGNAHGHEDVGVKHIIDFCTEYKVPNSYRDLAVLVCKYHTKIHGCLGRGKNKGMRPKSVMRLLEDTKAIQKPERFKSILKCCVADARGRGITASEIAHYEGKEYPQQDYLLRCLEAVKGVDTKIISSKLLERNIDGVTIGLEIRAARIKAIREVV